MISLIQAPFVGNALRLFIDPPAGAEWWQVQRRTADEFAGPNDPGAVLVANYSTDNVILDTTAVVNGTAYVYRVWYWDGAEFNESDPATGTAATSYARGGPEPQFIIADRLNLGLVAEIAMGWLKPDVPPGSPAGTLGTVDVITAPFLLAEDATFPTVTVHMDSVAPAERFIGENLYGEFMLPDGGIGQTEGWYARWSITVLGVSLNSDERIALRESVRRVIQANLPVFDDAGMLQIEFSQRDVEDTSSYAQPLYMTYGTFTCMAPAFVSDDVQPIADIQIQPVVQGSALYAAQSILNPVT